MTVIHGLPPSRTAPVRYWLETWAIQHTPAPSVAPRRHPFRTNGAQRPFACRAHRPGPGRVRQSSASPQRAGASSACDTTLAQSLPPRQNVHARCLFPFLWLPSPFFSLLVLERLLTRQRQELRWPASAKRLTHHDRSGDLPHKCRNSHKKVCLQVLAVSDL